MGKFSAFVKMAGSIVATTAALLTALRDNPAVKEGVDSAAGKLKAAAQSKNPKFKLDAKIEAIEAAAKAVDATYPGATEPEGWTRQAKALHMRADLAWNGHDGKARRKAMKALTAETLEVLDGVNTRLHELQSGRP